MLTANLLIAQVSMPRKATATPSPEVIALREKQLLPWIFFFQLQSQNY
jgi:hypothetical protein